MVRLTGAELVVLVTATGSDSFRIFAHRACCARAILRREAADIVRVGADMTLVSWFDCRDIPEPFSDSMTEIA